MSAVLIFAISAWKHRLEMLFFPRYWPVLEPALREETLPKLGQATQKQMRSDIGAKGSSSTHKAFEPEVTLLLLSPPHADTG